MHPRQCIKQFLPRLRAVVLHAIDCGCGRGTHEMYVICGAFILEPPLIIRNPDPGRAKSILLGVEAIAALRAMALPAWRNLAD